MSFLHSDGPDAVISGQLAVTVRILRVVFVEQSVVRDDVDRTFLVTHLPHLPVLALYLWQLDLAFHLLVLVFNGWLERLLFIVAFHVTIRLVVSRNIDNGWALRQFSTDLISPGLFFLFESWCSVDLLHLVDIGVTASLGSGFRDGSVTVSSWLVLRLIIV